MTRRDYYEILGVAKTATESEIKSAYRKMALQYHPDRNPGDAASEEMFKEAAEAYAVLSDTDKRAKYDRFGHEGVRGGAGGFEGFPNVEDIFSAFGFGDIFGGRRGGGEGAGPSFGSVPGNDLRVRLPLTLEEIATGVEKTINLKRLHRCAECDGNGTTAPDGVIGCTQCGGSGHVRQVTRSLFGQMITTAQCNNCDGEGKVIVKPCANCSGDGRIRADEKETVVIPAGVSDGNYLQLHGKGNVGPHGGPAGDLTVVIEEKEHDLFVRHGRDVVHDARITYPQATLGAEIMVPTLSGPAVLEVEPGTQSGTLLRMRNKGLPELNSTRRGDQIVRVIIVVPTKLTDEEKELLGRLSDTPNVGSTEESKEKGLFEKIKQAFS